MAKQNENQSAPTMSRTKIQLETSYAPGALFTFENNLVVCESIPKKDYRGASLSEYSETQILNGIEERITTWFEAAMAAENGAEPYMCVDSKLLNDDESGLRNSFRHNLFSFAEPGFMGYKPAALTFVCNRCKRVKTFSSVNDLSSRREELSPRKCANNDNPGACAWRQLDVVFIHPNGNYRFPEPWEYDYNAETHQVVRRKVWCDRCGSVEVCLDEKSAQIGKRTYYCANCGMPRGEHWLQNDQEWLVRHGENARREIQKIRMKPISYRSNAVHYPMQDMIIDFGNSSRLDVLTQPAPTALIEAVAKRFDMPVSKPSMEQIKVAVVETLGEAEWKKYEGLLGAIKGQEKLKAEQPKSVAELIDKAIESLQKSADEIQVAWQKDGIYRTQAEMPPNMEGNLVNRRELYASRYDPFRQLIEHQTLLDRIVSHQPMDNGMRHYTSMDRLDEYVGPSDEEERKALNLEHRRIMDTIGVETMGLVRKFETLQYSFAYSRVDYRPTTRYINNQEVPVRLKLFPTTQIDEKLRHPVFVLKQNNEAIYVRLQEPVVREWLSRINTDEELTGAPIGQQYLEHAPAMRTFLDQLPHPGAPSLPLAVYTLLHSFAHHVMMGVSEFSGLGIGSLGEYLFPADLAFIVYRKGMTMDMGNMTSMLRNNAPAFLKYMEDRRSLGCGSGSLCLSRGGACPDCLLIPEVSCIAQNRLLSRTALIGKDHPRNYGFRQPIPGYLDIAYELAQR